MDPYDAGYSLGRLAVFACCALFVLAVIGGVVWAIVYFSRKQSAPTGQPPMVQPPYPPAGQPQYPPAGQPQYPYLQPPAAPVSQPPPPPPPQQ